MHRWKQVIALVGFGWLTLGWLAEDVEARRCTSKYRCYRKKYCDLKPIIPQVRGRKRKYRYQCSYRRYCKSYRSCTQGRVPPPPPPPPPPSSGNDVPTMDFARRAGSSGIPQERLQAVVKARLPMVFTCFKRQLRRDRRFRGVKVVFTIRGDRGRVGRVSFEEASKPYRKLQRCMKRASRRWRFPRFNGSAFVVYPIFVQSQ